jgi:K+/H+ antiporter YhaU regulatory subunit KhtT
MVFNPDAKYQFSAGDILIIMGHREHIEQFREHFQVD